MMAAINAVTLWWAMVEKTWFFLRLVVLVCLGYLVQGAGTISSLIWGAVAAVNIVSDSDAAAYRVAGLGNKEWNRNQRITAGALAAAPLGMVLWHHNWLFAAPVCLALIVALVKPRGMPARSDKERIDALVANTSGRTEDGRFPPTPEGQVVYRPVVTWWLLLVGIFALVALVIRVMGHWIPTVTWMIPIVVFLTMVMFTVAGIGHADSLREYISIGGTRRRWAHITVACSLVGTVLIVALTAAMMWKDFDARFLCVGLLVAPLVFAEVFYRQGTALWVTALVLVSALVMAGALIAHVPPLAVVLIGVALHVLWLAAVPAMARRVRFDGWTLTRWLGMNREASH